MTMTDPRFHPSHVVPPEGLPAWAGPDGSQQLAVLDPLLPVELIDRRGDWARILCSNGWSAWVDGRLLVSVPQGPPPAGQPPARTADPRPLLARVEEELGRYRRAAEELASGRMDGETFQRETRGMRVGVVVDGEALWLYDAAHERWCYCDGIALKTLTASERPSAAVPEGSQEVAPEGAPPAASPGAPPGAPAAAPAPPTRVDPGAHEAAPPQYEQPTQWGR